MEAVHDSFGDAIQIEVARNHTYRRRAAFRRDPIDELYRACKKNGLRFGVYYSHVIDWLDGWNGGACCTPQP